MENIKKILLPYLEEKGLKLYEMKFVTEFGEKILRIIVDKEGAYINVGDCVKINALVGPIIDEADPIEGSYILDICSKEKGSL